MKNLWNEKEAQAFGNDPLPLRVYTSRLLGKEPTLVLHGGGNTSVKAIATDVFGNEHDVLFVKGSGWDLATIEAAGFAAVKLDVLKKMAELDNLSDTAMVKAQRAAMIDPTAPNPSVEAILHAIIPFTFVDHTHTDSLITLTNNPKGREIVTAVYGDSVMIVPYVMPGFLLAKKVHELCRGLDWSRLTGMVLLNHGLFTFGNTAKTSYERMIQLVSKAEAYLKQRKAWSAPAQSTTEPVPDLEKLAALRKNLSIQVNQAVIVKIDTGPPACGFAELNNVADLATRGPLTPDHVIRTKRIPLIVNDNHIPECVTQYATDYHDYFTRNTDGHLTCLDAMPRWGVWPGKGTLAFGKTIKEANINTDINQLTIKAIQWGEAIGGWQALPENDIFAVEYWELEQAKLSKVGKPLPLQSKVALVTGAAGGIGKACVEAFVKQGACVIALDIDASVEDLFNSTQAKGITCDITDVTQLKTAVETTIRTFGGLDLLINNAGFFPDSYDLEHMDNRIWEKSLAVNLTAQQQLLQLAVPYLKHGIDPSVIFIASKNVPAPGPGQAAYSVAKAGVTQLMRVAALELGQYGIRVNALHPNAVFDTGIWTEAQLIGRAKQYNLTVEEYKARNVLRTEITSKDVARLVTTLAGPAFSKTTGAQVPIDGGNDRVI